MFALAPVPRADHAVPFHLAIRLAGTPLMLVKLPATNREGTPSLSSSNRQVQLMMLLAPEPREVQLRPLYRAMALQVSPLMSVKLPAAKRAWPEPSSCHASAET